MLDRGRRVTKSFKDNQGRIPRPDQKRNIEWKERRERRREGEKERGREGEKERRDGEREQCSHDPRVSSPDCLWW